MVADWCERHGGVLIEESAYNSVLDGVFGGSYRLQTSIGPWVVHLPSDASVIFSINTRFEDWSGHHLPSGANEHSGKWNFTADSTTRGEAEELFRTFASYAARYVGEAAPAHSKHRRRAR